MTVSQNLEDNVTFRTIVLMLGVAVIGSNAFLMSPILNDIAHSLRASVAQVAWAVSAYGGSTAMAGLFLTGLAQRLEYRLTLQLSGCTLAAGILASGLATDWAILILAQSLAGVGAGIMLPTLYSMTAIIAPKGHESATLGKVITGWSLAMVAGVPLSAFVSDLLSWRYAYYLVFLLTFLATLGFSRLPPGRASVAGGSTTLVQALAIPEAKSTLMISFLYMVSFYGTYTFLGSQVQQGLDLAAAHAGFAVLAYGLGFGLAGMCGSLLDIWTPQKLIRTVLLAIAGIYLGFLLLAQQYWSLVLGCMLWGIVNQIGLNCLVSILTQLDERQRVRLMGIYSAVAYGGTMVAGITFGWLYQLGQFPILLLTAAALCLTAFLISVWQCGGFVRLGQPPW
ncbi:MULTISPECIES: MFS transporter [unclassified Halomonas]|uniref:MFS transporter n=1 Tax=unclassified Halomonas TaxID=2609666 RepID=UPI0007F14B2B|nr:MULTISPECIES: MFS transporter [unclassified Halomonas]SBR45806.1 Predicted arabinose efflux permease, MFS family [Halomonas sp. HL-93]SNY98458.1 Predicted arabinose efflux permease, MFS family [Halomonas sp. hl-4]